MKYFIFMILSISITSLAEELKIEMRYMDHSSTIILTQDEYKSNVDGIYHKQKINSDFFKKALADFNSIPKAHLYNVDICSRDYIIIKYTENKLKTTKHYCYSHLKMPKYKNLKYFIIRYQ